MTGKLDEQTYQQLMNIMDEVEVDHVVRSLGTGYLKVPKEVKDLLKDKHSAQVKTMPKPKILYGDLEDQIAIMYVFNKKEMPDNHTSSDNTQESE